MSGGAHAVHHGLVDSAGTGADRVEAPAQRSGAAPRFNVFAILERAKALGGDTEAAHERNIRAAILDQAVTIAADLGEARTLADELIALFESHGLLKPKHFIITVGSSAASEAAGLSEQERKILRCLVRGMPNKAIAGELGITESTVKVHLKHLLRKLRLLNRTQAALWAERNGYGPVTSPNQGESNGEEAETRQEHAGAV